MPVSDSPRIIDASYISSCRPAHHEQVGYDLSPTLAYEYKLFDSNWMATGLLIATGTNLKLSAPPISIPLACSLHYATAADAYLISDGDRNADDRNGVFVYGYKSFEECAGMLRLLRRQRHRRKRMLENYSKRMTDFIGSVSRISPALLVISKDLLSTTLPAAISSQLSREQSE